MVQEKDLYKVKYLACHVRIQMRYHESFLLVAMINVTGSYNCFVMKHLKIERCVDLDICWWDVFIIYLSGCWRWLTRSGR